MKASFFIPLLFLCVSANSQSRTEDTNNPARAIIKLSPLHFFSQTLELSVETLDPNYTRAFQISVALRSGQAEYIEGRGGGVTLAYRKYVRPLSTPSVRDPAVFQGIYYSVYLKGDVFQGEEDYWGQSQFFKTKENVRSIGPGFIIGLQRTIFQVLYMDVYIGGGIKFADVTYDGTAPDDQINYDLFHPAYEGIYPAVGLKIGVGL